ncbi:MAG: hypothetical protein Q9164_004721 [Protoblastenia rupestris]
MVAAGWETMQPSRAVQEDDAEAVGKGVCCGTVVGREVDLEASTDACLLDWLDVVALACIDSVLGLLLEEMIGGDVAVGAGEAKAPEVEEATTDWELAD